MSANSSCGRNELPDDGRDDPECQDDDACDERLAAKELVPELRTGEVALVRDEPKRRVDPSCVVDHPAHASSLLASLRDDRLRARRTVANGAPAAATLYRCRLRRPVRDALRPGRRSLPLLRTADRGRGASDARAQGDEHVASCRGRRPRARGGRDDARRGGRGRDPALVQRGPRDSERSATSRTQPTPGRATRPRRASRCSGSRSTHSVLHRVIGRLEARNTALPGLGSSPAIVNESPARREYRAPTKSPAPLPPSPRVAARASAAAAVHPRRASPART